MSDSDDVVNKINRQLNKNGFAIVVMAYPFNRYNVIYMSYVYSIKKISPTEVVYCTNLN